MYWNTGKIRHWKKRTNFSIKLTKRGQDTWQLTIFTARHIDESQLLHPHKPKLGMTGCLWGEGHSLVNFTKTVVAHIWKGRNAFTDPPRTHVFPPTFAESQPSNKRFSTSPLMPALKDTLKGYFVACNFKQAWCHRRGFFNGAGSDKTHLAGKKQTRSILTQTNTIRKNAGKQSGTSNPKPSTTCSSQLLQENKGTTQFTLTSVSLGSVWSQVCSHERFVQTSSAAYMVPTPQRLN